MRFVKHLFTIICFQLSKLIHFNMIALKNEITRCSPLDNSQTSSCKFVRIFELIFDISLQHLFQKVHATESPLFYSFSIQFGF